MRYIIRERFFHLGEDSDITDERGQPVYQVDGKVLTLRDTLVVRDRTGGRGGHGAAPDGRAPPDLPHRAPGPGDG